MNNWQAWRRAVLRASRGRVFHGPGVARLGLWRDMCCGATRTVA
ncbi:MAG: hypothetical protein WCK65_13525 [Rhodospirillaceae bacterium]